MIRTDLCILAKQLEEERKELIAITDGFILVYWEADKSFVSWRYWYSQEKRRYVFDTGHYLPIHTGATKNDAIAKFNERINS